MPRVNLADRSFPVTVTDVNDYLGNSYAEGMVMAHIETASDLVEGYTRGHGFDDYGYPYADVRRVIIAVAARSVVNPLSLQREQAGSQSVAYGRFEGFTLAEQKILNRYRSQAF